MILDFSKVKFTDVRDKEFDIPDFNKTIADIIYMNTQSVDMLEIARQINQGPVDLTKVQIGEIKLLLTNDQSTIKAFVKVPLLEYFDEVLENGA